MGTISLFNLDSYIKKYNIKIFIETGTHIGDGVEYANNFEFKEIYSIELIKELYEKAKNRFKCNDKVTIINGNSFDVLESLLTKINDNILFWLDAHFPEISNIDTDTFLPLRKEMLIIEKTRQNHKDVIIIDDLRIFEDNNYASKNLADISLQHLRKYDLSFLDISKYKVTKKLEDQGYIILEPIIC